MATEIAIAALTEALTVADTDVLVANVVGVTEKVAVSTLRTQINNANQSITGDVAITGNLSVSGDVTALRYYGNGAALTGITGATGGVANAGTTTIGADTDVDGSGVIALQTRLVTRMTIENLGDVTVETGGNLIVTDNVGIGTASPGVLLNLSGEDTAILRLENSDTSLTTDQLIGEVQFYANDGSSFGTGPKSWIKGINTSAGGTISALTFGTAFSTEATGIERMRIAGNGNVGIGTDDPQRIFNIESNVPVIRLSDNNATDLVETTGFIEFYQGNNTAQAGFLGFPSSIDSDIYIRNNTSSGVIRFDTNGANERMRIDSSGNVGIGTDSPQNLLDVRGAAGVPGTLYLGTDELTVVDADRLGQIYFNAPLESSGTDAILPGAVIRAEAETTFAADNNQTSLIFGTASSGTAVEKVRIDSFGNTNFNYIGALSGTQPIGQLVVGNGTIPDAHTDNTTILGSKDSVAGGACLSIYQESGVTTEVVAGDTTARIWINGLEYKMILNSV